MKDRKERFDNIKLMEQKLNRHIEIFFAVNGNDIKDTNMIKFDKKLQVKKNFHLKGQLGCYLSHFLLLKEIYSNNFEHEYTVIFEDDFDIKINDLDDKIKETISKIDIDVDFIFLGIEGFCVGEKYKDNLHFINKNLKTWGFQGYVVKNKNIGRILENLYDMHYEVDIQLFRAIKHNLLSGLFVYPNYVNQNKNLISIIRPKTKNSSLIYKKILYSNNCINKHKHSLIRKNKITYNKIQKEVEKKITPKINYVKSIKKPKNIKKIS